MVGRGRIQRYAKPGDTGDGEGPGDSEERNTGEGYPGWEKRPEKSIASVASGSVQVSGFFVVAKDLKSRGPA